MWFDLEMQHIIVTSWSSKTWIWYLIWLIFHPLNASCFEAQNISILFAQYHAFWCPNLYSGNFTTLLLKHYDFILRMLQKMFLILQNMRFKRLTCMYIFYFRSANLFYIFSNLLVGCIGKVEWNYCCNLRESAGNLIFSSACCQPAWRGGVSTEASV